MNVPRNTPTDASSSHGLPLSNSKMPQLMKKANNANVTTASVNFIGASITHFSAAGKPRPGGLI